MPNDPEISVIIPHRNNVRFLGEALQSVYAQKYRPAEIIIVDDASGKTEKEFLHKLIEEAELPLEVIFLSNNKGSGAARNAGIKKARGTYLAFLDADDLWHPDHLENFVKAWRLHENLPFYSAQTRVFSGHPEMMQPSKNPVFLRENYFKAALKNPLIVNSSSVIVKKEMLEETGGFNENIRVFEDIDLWIRLGDRNPLVYTNTLSVFYRKPVVSGGSRRLEAYRNPRLSAVFSHHLAHAKTEEKRRWIHLNIFGWWMRFVKAGRKAPQDIKKLMDSRYLPPAKKWFYEIFKWFF